MRNRSAAAATLALMVALFAGSAPGGDPARLLFAPPPASDDARVWTEQTIVGELLHFWRRPLLRKTFRSRMAQSLRSARPVAPAIVFLSAAQVESAVALLRETFPDDGPDDHARFVEMLNRVVRGERKDGAWAALSGGRVVGFVMAVPAGREVELANLAVAPQARRQGLGTALVETALAWAQAQKFIRATAVTKIGADSGQLLLKLGFHVVKHRQGATYFMKPLLRADPPNLRLLPSLMLFLSAA